jgi:integrase
MTVGDGTLVAMAHSEAAGRPPVVLRLDRVVDGLVGGVSSSRARQLRMVAAMWERALEQWPDDVARPRQVRGVFADEALRAFWALASEGRLRAREQEVGRAPSGATLRVVRDCLGILAGAVCPGEEVWLPRVPQQEPKAVVPVRQLPVLYRKLADLASDAPVERGAIALSRDDRVRLLALVAVVLDTGARSSELAAMRLADLGDGEESVWVRRQPQNGLHLPAVDEEFGLRAGTGVALRRWLRVRAGLVARLEGTQSALWVSLRANQWQGEPGFQLRPQGVRKAYTRGAVALNGLMAGRMGWSPLPTTLEQLRRTVVVEPRPEPGRGAARGGGGIGGGGAGGAGG